MPIFNLTELFGQLTRNQRLLGVDPGLRTVGLALSDVRRVLASPFGNIRRGKLADNAQQIGHLAQKEGAAGLVVGLPLEMDGGFGPAAQAARDWTHALSTATGLPALMWDERLSSAAVNRMLVQDADLSRGKRAAVVDRASAAYILQGALDAYREQTEGVD